VLGLRLAAAKKKIRRAHCSVGRVRRVRSRRSLYGRVVNQSPRPRTVKRRGFPVKLAVGRR
jgi:beta-lactam-binding protein with PASTA domain